MTVGSDTEPGPADQAARGEAEVPRIADPESGAINWPRRVVVDLSRLRSERYRKVQGELQSRDIAAAVLTDVINIRYATGASLMTLWSAYNLVRYVVVPAVGEPTIFEVAEAVHRTEKLWRDVRPARYWQYRFTGAEAADQARLWAAELGSVLRERGLRDEQLALDTADVLGFRALEAEGFHLVDADEPLQAARLVKTDDEIELMKESAAVGETALYALETEIRPGVTERELLAQFWHKMLNLGGEYCYTRLVNSGDRTNPWFNEATARVVRPGDLVGVDTDMIGPEGYACDVSRTFLCGERATSSQREAYRVALDFVEGITALLEPGLSYRELAARIPQLPEAYREQPYPDIVHGLGMDDESPFIGFPNGTMLVPDGYLQPGMVLCVEGYAGRVGAQDGVKLENELLITDAGCIPLSRYPYCAALR
jgi:Xaa-Pro aminopeptidase